MDRLLPFLRPIEDLLRDPRVTEVMVNAGGARVVVERHGRIACVPDRVLEPRNLTVAIENIARACGDEISEVRRCSDARSKTARTARPCSSCALAGPAAETRRCARARTSRNGPPRSTCH
jgi:Flp pilus assembly CpaF family ATPase